MDKEDWVLVCWWGVLVVLTLCAFETGLFARAGVIAVVLVIAIAMIKVRIVIMHFMEVHESPLALRIPLEIWVLGLGTAILTLWFSGVS